jgi:hypothetical protein
VAAPGETSRPPAGRSDDRRWGGCRGRCHTFLTLTDTLTRDFDALEMLTTLSESCVQLLDVSAAGVILTDGRGGLSVAAASSERSRLLGVFAVAIDSGPCVGCLFGVLTLLHTERHTLTDDDARLGQALGDAATIGLLHERAMRLPERPSTSSSRAP